MKTILTLPSALLLAQRRAATLRGQGSGVGDEGGDTEQARPDATSKNDGEPGAIREDASSVLEGSVPVMVMRRDCTTPGWGGFASGWVEAEAEADAKADGHVREGETGTARGDSGSNCQSTLGRCSEAGLALAAGALVRCRLAALAWFPSGARGLQTASSFLAAVCSGTAVVAQSCYIHWCSNCLSGVAIVVRTGRW
ncbi:hypothetical protein BCR44DRAFT_1445485 [Catenaria anguillulae PL171]|uniref:Uncharacterized protein n=1 Tax=Catenaria anguillulae PL171 TaxID=765915 RepID=A0A1Y2H8G1_9FUNG|nr:hypothetical protein BCR44DRAFT_1445485 [Catenaria anguillulae PL171]